MFIFPSQKLFHSRWEGGVRKLCISNFSFKLSWFRYLGV